MRETGTTGQMVHLPNAGGAACLAAVLSGDAWVGGGSPSVMNPQIEAGMVIPLAMAYTERWPTNPDLPTVKELMGFDAVATSTVGLFAPAGIPEDRLQFLREAFKGILHDESVVKLAAKSGGPISYNTGEQFQKDWLQGWADADKLAPLLKGK